MSATRINPDSGIIEQDASAFGGTFGHTWEPKENNDGNAERINPDSGVVEQDVSAFGGVFGHTWEPKD